MKFYIGNLEGVSDSKLKKLFAKQSIEVNEYLRTEGKHFLNITVNAELKDKVLALNGKKVQGILH